MSTKLITFTARNNREFQIQDKPYPAATALPEWWKEETSYAISPENPDGKRLLIRNRQANTTFKRCTPMLDAMTSGYIISLWSDVQITQDSEVPYITWRTQDDVFSLHGDPSRQVPNPAGYTKAVYKYNNTWIPKTPKGYSCFVTSPNGYQDLPFKAVPGIVDTDKAMLELLFPVWVKSGFEGIVKAGTPIVQIIPFKRDNWAAEFDVYEDGEYEILKEKSFSKHIISHYKQYVWSRKYYR